MIEGYIWPEVEVGCVILEIFVDHTSYQLLLDYSPEEGRGTHDDREIGVCLAGMGDPEMPSIPECQLYLLITDRTE